MTVGTQSPSHEKADPLFVETKKQMSQADQRPDASGAKPNKPPPGQESSGVPKEAVKAAEQSANAMGEKGKTRKEVETGSGPS
ncbi:uncharacterized protein L203_106284 [Cryptococcus depauperatus CBS 7841]|uniref:Uncharacterized protein n=1 Tax=Cryptococcus depauperatus CBS 7841 TaxID=1295531 RepID=A0AAJ8M4U1_9TREE